jgi:hypothetical protein
MGCFGETPHNLLPHLSEGDYALIGPYIEISGLAANDINTTPEMTSRRWTATHNQHICMVTIGHTLIPNRKAPPPDGRPKSLYPLAAMKLEAINANENMTTAKPKQIARASRNSAEPFDDRGAMKSFSRQMFLGLNSSPQI